MLSGIVCLMLRGTAHIVFSAYALQQCDDVQKDDGDTKNAGARQKATNAAVQEPRSSLQQSLQHVHASLNWADWQQRGAAK